MGSSAYFRSSGVMPSKPAARLFLSVFYGKKNSGLPKSDGGFVSTNGLGGVAAARSLNSGQGGAGGKLRVDLQNAPAIWRGFSLADKHADPSSFLRGRVSLPTSEKFDGTICRSEVVLFESNLNLRRQQVYGKECFSRSDFRFRVEDPLCS